MPPRRNRKSVTIGRRKGQCNGAVAKEVLEESVLGESQASSVPETMSIAPSTETPIDVVAEVHQPAEQSFSASNDDLPSIDTAKSKKKRKRECVTSGFTEKQEQDMVDWLKAPEQECLLNKKHLNYTKKDLKDALCDQKAKEMDKSSELLKKWYTNMRSRFAKLKQAPSCSGDVELTTRDRWILLHFEFLRPYLIVQVKRRVTVSMKAKIQASEVPPSTAVAPQSESEVVNEHPPTSVQSDADTSLISTTSVDPEATKSNIVQLQTQLLDTLSKAEKSSLQRQRDAFAEFLKEVTYTFPPPMWMRFQTDINSLLQKYQFELQHPLSTQAHRQNQQQQQQQ